MRELHLCVDTHHSACHQVKQNMEEILIKAFSEPVGSVEVSDFVCDCVCVCVEGGVIYIWVCGSLLLEIVSGVLWWNIKTSPNSDEEADSPVRRLLWPFGSVVMVTWSMHVLGFLFCPPKQIANILVIYIFISPVFTTLLPFPLNGSAYSIWSGTVDVRSLRCALNSPRDTTHRVPGKLLPLWCMSLHRVSSHWNLYYITL